MRTPAIVNEDGWVHVDDIAPSVILYRTIGNEEARYVTNALPDTEVVAVVDVKGGVKKTTCAVHTAFSLHRHATRKSEDATVMVGDCDQYHSVADWRTEAARDDPWPSEITVVSSSGDNYHHDLIQSAQQHKPRRLVIDTPPNDEEAALRAMLLADVVVIPTGPFHLDIRRLRHALRVGSRAVDMRGRGLDVRALLTGTKMGTNIYKAARVYLQQEGLPFFQMPVRDLLRHAQNFGTSSKDLGDYEYIADELAPLLAQLTQNKIGSHA